MCLLCLTFTPLSAAIIQDTPAFGPLSGTGLGNVSTVLTINSPGSTTSSTGCSYWDGSSSQTGAGCPVSGFGGDELALNSTYTIADLGLATFADLRIIYNSSEPGGAANSVTLQNLVLILQSSDGTPIADFTPLSLTAPIFYPDVAQGTGNAGFFFRLDDAGVTAANAFWASLGNSTDLRIGLAALVNDEEDGGNETFFLANAGGATPDPDTIPEPQSAVLIGTGILLVGLFSSKKRRRA